MELKVEVDFVSDSVVLNLSWERKKKKANATNVWKYRKKCNKHFLNYKANLWGVRGEDGKPPASKEKEEKAQQNDK